MDGKSGNQKDKVYHSGMSILYVSFIGMFFLIAHILYHNNGLGIFESFIGALSLLFLSYILLWFLILPCKYILKDDYIQIQSGFLTREKIPYLQIKSFEKSNILLGGLAHSFSRIKIIHRGRKFGIQLFTMVSPKDRNAFIQDLEERIA